MSWPAAAIAALPRCDGRWHVVPTPSPQETQQLNGVSAWSDSNAWAAGYSYDVGSPTQPLLVHWDGTAWTEIPGPTFSGQGAIARGIVQTGPSEAWVAGLRDDSPPPALLLERWDGTAWSIVKAPDPGKGTLSGSAFYAIAALGSDDVWAVGVVSVHSGTAPLVEHFDGVKWKVIPAPSPPGVSDAPLYGVAAVGPSDVWAVGFTVTGNSVHTLTEHYDGTSWSIVPSPNPDSVTDNLWAVTAAGPKDVWAVGDAGDSDGFGTHTLTMHWDGSVWSVVLSPSPGSTGALLGVGAWPTGRVWAVGGYEDKNLALKWNGTKWKITKTPSPGSSANALRAVAATGNSSGWAVGSKVDGDVVDGIAEHVCS
jgi:hypothetical protein